MSNVRLRRLQADHQNLVEYIRRHPRLRLIQTAGDPPEQYQIEYRIKSLRQVGENLQPTKSHIVEISLPRNYPRTPPLCRMLTPVFHPNIAPHAICVGDHWSAGEPLKSIVARIGEMLAYQSYNVKSPLNGEAARWVEQHLDELPLDKVSLLVEETSTDGTTGDDEVEGEEVGSAAPPPPPPSPPKFREPAAAPSATAPAVARAAPQAPTTSAPDSITVACPQCGTQYRLSAANIGKRARCRDCQTIFPIEPPSADHSEPGLFMDS